MIIWGVQGQGFSYSVYLIYYIYHLYIIVYLKTPVYKTSTFQASYFEVNKAVKIKIYNSGDDHYIDEDEEERTVISRWAQRKVAPQFNEELLDGCNKQHRQIHEKSLPHYFNSKGGQKFEYQPKPKPVFTPKPDKAKITQPSANDIQRGVELYRTILLVATSP